MKYHLTSRPERRETASPERGACVLVPECRQEFLDRAAEELTLSLQGSAIAEMLSDYLAMWEQTGLCAGQP